MRTRESSPISINLFCFLYFLYENTSFLLNVCFGGRFLALLGDGYVCMYVCNPIESHFQACEVYSLEGNK